MLAMQAWLGFSQSLRPSQGGLTLNVDIAATAFLEPVPCLDYLLRNADMRDPMQQLAPMARKRAGKAFQGIKVTPVVGLFLHHLI